MLYIIILVDKCACIAGGESIGNAMYPSMLTRHACLLVGATP